MHTKENGTKGSLLESKEQCIWAKAQRIPIWKQKILRFTFWSKQCSSSGQSLATVTWASYVWI